jgi:citrate synthase
MSTPATLEVEGKTYALPVVVGTEGERAVSISALRDTSGYITLDDGYGNTGSCVSNIAFIDGEQGILRYRGIPIEELAEKSTFIEIAYLLIYGNLPTRSQLRQFSDLLTDNQNLHEDMKYHFEGFPSTAHPMAILSAMINASSCFYAGLNGPRNADRFDVHAARLISQVRTIDLIFLLHADHEQNCSTATVRMVASSQANLFACAAAGVCALWGPLHGGANQAVVEMLEDIRRSGDDGSRFIAAAKDKSSGKRLMGFGHRVYRHYDPRAKIIKRACDEILNTMHVQDALLDIAKKLEDAALHDPYFLERKLYPNVDFYSGIIMRAVGIPLEMFTVIFAIGRMPGWIANFKEILDDPKGRIYRPRQIYTGPTLRHYVPLDERENLRAKGPG